MLARSKRLQKELQQLQQFGEDERRGIILGPVDADDDHGIGTPISDRWFARIRGPPDSFYDGYYFDLKIEIPTQYPLVPPHVTFQTKIFHPNVLFESGEICLDILKREAWSPAWSLHSTCRALIALLADPAADSPLNCDAGNMLRSGDFRAYRTMVRMYCQDYCQKG